MKILYHHRVASKDGQYVHIEEIVGALRELGHEVIMAEPASINNKDFGKSSGLVKNIRTLLPGFVHELMEFIYSFFDYVKLVRLIRKHRPDCIYERYNLFFPSGIWAKKRYKLPLLLEVNAPLYAERSQHDSIQLNKLADWSERYVWNNAEYVLPVTGVLARKVIEKGVAKDRIVVIPNGINFNKFVADADRLSELAKSHRREYKLEEKLVLGFTGFVREWHRLDRVLEVIATNKDQNWHLFLVGDGPARADLEKTAQSLGIKDRMTITGIVGRDQMPGLVATFDIALQPDVVEYASPLKLFEYLALAKAILAPNSENICEILTDEKNALLFDIQQPTQFADQLYRLCSSTELRDRLGGAAFDTIENQKLYWRHNAEKIVQLFGHKIDGTALDQKLFSLSDENKNSQVKN
ncbi:MAG: glycosyltransferase family 4 protein [Pseudomonadales bacterium]|nr:glycosyltransferase family 4 protein [Pseudomonadales bacterium]